MCITTADACVGTGHRLLQRPCKLRPIWQYWQPGIPSLPDTNQSPVCHHGRTSQRQRRVPQSGATMVRHGWPGAYDSHVRWLARNQGDRDRWLAELARSERPPAALTRQTPGCELSSQLGRHQLEDEALAARRQEYRRSAEMARRYAHVSTQT